MFRQCTCHPDDNPPSPCAGKYALSECRAAAEFAPPTPYTTDTLALEMRLGELHDKYCLPYRGSIFGWAASVVRDYRLAHDNVMQNIANGLTPAAKEGLERIIATVAVTHAEARKEAGVLQNPEPSITPAGH